MSMGGCDVSGCKRETYMGWRLLSVRAGRQICEHHWNRHRSEKDEFSLFDAFGFRRPSSPPSAGKDKTVRLCICGAELEPKHTYCETCARKRERERKREYRRRKAKKQQHAIEELAVGRNTLRCKDCGRERLPGHTYCEKCARRRKQQFNRCRQRKYRKRTSLKITQE